MQFILALCFVFSVCSLQAQTDTTQIPKTDSAVYYNPDMKAEYPGGQNAWMRFLTKNLMYPAEAAPKEIQGIVVTQFIVDSTGLAHNATAIGGPEELRDESIRVIKKVKVWIPAKYHGRKVNSWKTQNIQFRLESQ